MHSPLKNKKVLFLCLVLLVAVFSTNADSSSKEVFLNDVFQTFTLVVDTFAEDYSTITGLYTAGGELRGAASIGKFPSFRVGTTFGTIFFTNPINFLKKVDFYETTWGDIESQLETLGAGTAINWFDDNFLPIPVVNYHFHVGLPFGLTVGTKFNVSPIGALVNAAAPDTAGSFINDILMWGIGANLTYTILREYKYLPTISTGFGVQYSDTKVDITGIPLGRVNLDESNDAVPTEIGFFNHNNNVSIYFDFSISKRLAVFQPFFSMKFVQTINHNITKISVDLDEGELTADGRDSYGDVEVSNITETDSFGNDIGTVIPVTDFIISGGFEFIIYIFRLGMEGSFSLASQTGMVTLGMRFQIEDWQFARIKNRIGNRPKKVAPVKETPVKEVKE